jgi:hypothetical protein
MGFSHGNFQSFYWLYIKDQYENAYYGIHSLSMNRDVEIKYPSSMSG